MTQDEDIHTPTRASVIAQSQNPIPHSTLQYKGLTMRFATTSRKEKIRVNSFGLSEPCTNY
ncbi:MAG: hypothetical protein AAF352_08520, partial [Pseudomonadota bacterium]